MSFSRLCRGREEDDGCAGREGPQGSTPGKRPRRCSCSCSCCQETKDFYEDQIDILKKQMQCLSKGNVEERKTFQKEMQEFYQNSQLQLKEQISEHCRRMEVCYHNSHQLILEQFNTLISEIRASGDHVWRYNNLRVLSDQDETKTYRLKFENKCSNDKYSGHVIMADDGNPIKVAIYDHDNKIISDGPLSSMQVKIVILHGEFNKENKDQWSGDSFLKNIVVYSRPGKPPLLADELYIKLENGVANLRGIKFQDNVPSKKFRLGVMAADDNISEKILEGVSESFAIKAGRGFSKKKDRHPSLTDPIYKLKKIWENGDRHKLLEQMEIKLVKDFLWFYNKDNDGLRKACGNISAHDWNIIVEHALSCRPGRDRYSYHIPEMDATIFFNSLYIIVGAEFNGKYRSYEELNDTQKVLVDASKTSAYENLKVVRHDDKNPFHEHGVLAGDKAMCYLRGSCSIQQVPTLPPKLHAEISNHEEALENVPSQESPRHRQRWVKIVTIVTTLNFWNKKPLTESSFGMADIFDLQVEPEKEMCQPPLTESNIGMTDMFDDSWVDPETGLFWDCSNMFY